MKPKVFVLTIAQQKQSLRARIAERFKREPHLFQSDAPAQALLASPEYAKVRTVLGYVSMAHEISTDAILADVLRSGRRLVLPRTVSKAAPLTLHLVSDLAADLEVSKLGFRQPKAALPEAQAAEIDLVIVPGVAFDAKGHRLGRGAGHYDRLLASEGMRATVVALAAEAQIVDDLPNEPHDRPVHVIFTPARTIRGLPIS